MSASQFVPGGLTESQIDAFLDEGYLIVEGLLTDSDLQPAIDDINHAIDESVSELMAAGKLSQAYAHLRTNHVPTATTDRWGRWWEGEANTPGRD